MSMSTRRPGRRAACGSRYRRRPGPGESRSGAPGPPRPCGSAPPARGSARASPPAGGGAREALRLTAAGCWSTATRKAAVLRSRSGPGRRRRGRAARRSRVGPWIGVHWANPASFRPRSMRGSRSKLSKRVNRSGVFGSGIGGKRDIVWWDPRVRKGLQILASLAQIKQKSYPRGYPSANWRPPCPPRPRLPRPSPCQDRCAHGQEKSRSPRKFTPNGSNVQ